MAELKNKLKIKKKKCSIQKVSDFYSAYVHEISNDKIFIKIL